MELPENWTVTDDGDRAHLELATKDFVEAVALINDIAPVAEELEHHPDIHLEQWNQLRIVTWSHDVGTLTDRDERLAERINAVLRKRGFLS